MTSGPPHGTPSGAVIIAPFWGASAHVGVYRVERFIRWLSGRGFPLLVVRAGSTDACAMRSWGQELTVRDPIGFYRDAPAGSGPPIRRGSAIRRAVAVTVLSPDPGVVWARYVARHPGVLAAAAGARWVLSSSPPESAHLAAWKLARRLGATLVADMRDGWLDEPNRPTLRYSPLHVWYEGRWERRVLFEARATFVTSPVWRDLLVRRVPASAGSVIVLPNGYPRAMPNPARVPRAPAAGLYLLHSGRFTTSRGSQAVERLLRPLLAGIARSASRGTVRLLGDLAPRDHAAVAHATAAFAARGWQLGCTERVGREAALVQLQEADGLLLLAVSRAAIPSKLFEYLAAERPVLAVTGAGSAVWQACEGIASVFRVNLDRPDTHAADVASFLAACERGTAGATPPERFAEPALERVFARGLGLTP